MAGRDDYVPVTATLRRVTGKAVLLAGEDGECWIPRSCINGADERALDSLSLDEEVTLRMFEWIAEREGLI
jgi:hypothetical protein